MQASTPDVTQVESHIDYFVQKNVELVDLDKQITDTYEKELEAAKEHGRKVSTVSPAWFFLQELATKATVTTISRPNATLPNADTGRGFTSTTNEGPQQILQVPNKARAREKNSLWNIAFCSNTASKNDQTVFALLSSYSQPLAARQPSKPAQPAVIAEGDWLHMVRMGRRKHFTWESVGGVTSASELPFATEAGGSASEAVCQLRMASMALLTGAQLSSSVNHKDLLQKALLLLVGVPSDIFPYDPFAQKGSYSQAVQQGRVPQMVSVSTQVQLQDLVSALQPSRRESEGAQQAPSTRGLEAPAAAGTIQRSVEATQTSLTLSKGRLPPKKPPLSQSSSSVERLCGAESMEVCPADTEEVAAGSKPPRPPVVPPIPPGRGKGARHPVSAPGKGT
ncbi:hypothetical protein HPB50_007245 [Hyalomma asiaticum]|uniref:Uncharacterized protein n=2 Tax=Hyalomma asiaticum TaxID=266040 RepID=A0ACB7RIA9_HYAAI|nr:hypothetical protein HPB50_007245 [Hyalomma asiaticum]